MRRFLIKGQSAEVPLGRWIAFMLGTAVAVLAGSGTSVRAGYDVSGNSSGVAILSNLTLGSLASANVSINPLSGTAPNPYDSTSTIGAGATISSGGFLTGTLLTGSTGLLTTTSSSTINGFSTSGLANASTLINNLNLNVLGSLVSIGATTLTSSASVSGTFGSLAPSSTSSISGLSIKVLGLDVTSLIEGSSGAFVSISGVAGLQIGIDMKTITGDGIATSGTTVDNIIVKFNGVADLGLTLNGSLEIGQSQAFAQAAPGSAVPEPSAIALTAVGLTLAAAGKLRRVGKISTRRSSV